MKDNLGMLLVGVVLGVIGSCIYFNNEGNIKKQTRRIVAGSRKLRNMDLIDEAGDSVGK